MSNLNNIQKNISIRLTPVLKDDFGFKCDFSIHSDLITFDYEHVKDSEKYLSHQNLAFLIEDMPMFDDISNQKDEELFFSLYPIDMFFTMDVYKSGNEHLLIELKIPIGVYTNSDIKGYFIGFTFDASLTEFHSFLDAFIQETKNFF